MDLYSGAWGGGVVGGVGANKESVSEGKKTSSKNGSKKLRAYGTDGFIMKLETIVDRGGVESIKNTVYHGISFTLPKSPKTDEVACARAET